MAVLRSADANAAVRTADALVAGGVTAIEITYTTPDAGRAIAELAGRGDPGVVVGAGTVTNREQAEEAVGAGAEFVVTPGTTESLAAAVTATGVASIMGALTPSEVMQVLAWGATAVKVFPGSIGGPHICGLCGAPSPTWW